MKDIRKIFSKIFQIFLDCMICIFLIKNMILRKLFLKHVKINKRKKTNWLEPHQKRTKRYNLLGKLMRAEIKLLVYLLKLYPTNSRPKTSRKTLLDFKYEMF